MSAHMGTIVVTCPGCGEAFDVAVQLYEIKFGYEQLHVSLSGSSIPHKCKGRP